MRNSKILVVDDSPTQLKMMTSALSGRGYDIITATNGEEALQKAETEKPSLIVLDVIMPKVNGFQVCRKIKKSPELKNIKVILCTSKSQESDIFWGKQQGAEEYITKPFDDQQLISVVERLL